MQHDAAGLRGFLMEVSSEKVLGMTSQWIGITISMA